MTDPQEGPFSRVGCLGRGPQACQGRYWPLCSESLFMGHTPTHKTSFLLFPFGPYHFSLPSQEIALVWYKLVFTDRMAMLVSFLSPLSVIKKLKLF